jgi:hypothetical protein
MPVSKPLTVELLVYAPTVFFHCQHCEFVWHETGVAPDYRTEQTDSAIPPELKQEYQRLSDWVIKSAQMYGGRVVFKVIDAASIEGVFKSIRYGVRKYPAMIVGGKEKIVGLEFAKAEETIARRLEVLELQRASESTH